MTSRYCGGQVRQFTSDQSYIYCGMTGGVILIFMSKTLLYVTRLEEKESNLWQLQVGRSVVVALTEVCALVWRKRDWSLVSRVKYWSEVTLLLSSSSHHVSQGQPYLHLEGDMMVLPGATKYTARLLIYDRQEERLCRVRDLVHTKVWVVGAHIEGEHVVSLAVPCQDLGWRELTVWQVRRGTRRHTMRVQGAMGGFPALRYPHVFLPSARTGLEVWRTEGDSGKVSYWFCPHHENVHCPRD